MFCKLKPCWVKKEKDRLVCCCKYHMELNSMIAILNDRRMQHGDDDMWYGSGCGCECTSATCFPCNGKISDRRNVARSGETLEGSQSLESRREDLGCNVGFNTMSIRDILREFLCPPIYIPMEGDEAKFWFKTAYVNMECSSCGMGKLEASFCLFYESVNTSFHRSMKWKLYEYMGQGVKDDRGQEKKRLELVHVETSILDFIQYFTDKAKGFVKHDFTNKWQAKQYKYCIRTFTIGTVVSVIDFAENYTFMPRRGSIRVLDE
ncbi:hypothetical protein R1flu_019144 [Riccia fluitans]|uniref:Uncharacterized protein n=1 Tax=Riccia fluitans TaxID=41844 RepID=A0ABD1ZHU1_9MARC